jgi:hypothetical protein
MEKPTYKTLINIKMDLKGIGLDGEKWVHLARERCGKGGRLLHQLTDHWHH